MAITNWPKEERPHEKLLLQGPKKLSDAELLAIFLKCGIKGKTAVDLAREILFQSGGLKKLVSAGPDMTVKGLGKAKVASLIAAIELGQRCLMESIAIGEMITSTKTAKSFLKHHLKEYPHEVFACLFLNTQQRLIAYEELFHGTINESSIYPREVVKRGLAHNASKMILAHNHPSGNTTPSQADLDITFLLRQSLSLIEIKVIDHIIVGQQDCFSMAESGLL